MGAETLNAERRDGELGMRALGGLRVCEELNMFRFSWIRMCRKRLIVLEMGEFWDDCSKLRAFFSHVVRGLSWELRGGTKF